MASMRLSPHFDSSEFGLPAYSPENHFLYAVYYNLCNNLLEPIRARFNLPIKITSGYRDPGKNKSVGGAKRSQHMATSQHCAADFKLNWPLEEVFDWIRSSNLVWDQCILERPAWDQDPSCIHISWCRGPQRRQALEGLSNGRGRYFYREVKPLLEEAA